MKTMTMIAAAAALAGCGGASPVPADRLARAQQMVRAAEAVPAAAIDPRATMHLQMAKDQLDYGKRLLVSRHNDDARWTLMRAEADARAALYMAHEREAKVDAREAIEAIHQAMNTMQQEGDGS